MVALLAQADAMTQGPSHIQKAKPNGREAIISVPLRLDIPSAMIPVHAVGLQQMSGVIQRAKPAMTFEQRVVLLRFFAFPNALFSFGMIPIVVILMHGANDGRGVNQPGAGIPRIPEQPVVPARPADHKPWDLFVEKALAKDKIINPLRGLLAIRLDSQFSHFVLPAWAFEEEWFANIKIPAGSSHKQGIGGAGDTRDSSGKIIQQKNVAIYMAEQIVARKLLRLIVNAGKVFFTVAILAHARHMTKAQFRAYLCGARIIAKKQNLHFPVDLLPTAQGISLDHVDVTLERLRGGKKRQHAPPCSVPLAARRSRIPERTIISLCGILFVKAIPLTWGSRKRPMARSNSRSTHPGDAGNFLSPQADPVPHPTNPRSGRRSTS